MSCLPESQIIWMNLRRLIPPGPRRHHCPLTQGLKRKHGPTCFPEIPFPRSLEASAHKPSMCPAEGQSTTCPLSLTVLGLPMPETDKTLTFPLASHKLPKTGLLLLKTREAICNADKYHFTCQTGGTSNCLSYWSHTMK